MGDPDIAGMGMLDLVDEVKRVRAERDRLRDLAEAMADEHGCVCETWREGMCSTCLYRPALDGEETP